MSLPVVPVFPVANLLGSSLWTFVSFVFFVVIFFFPPPTLSVLRG
jgi:hypothetical protein